MPAAALAAKNTSSGPSSMASLMASAPPDSAFCGPAPGAASGCCGIPGVQTGNGAGEILSVEGLQIVDAFADADGAHRQSETLGDGRKNAAACGSVELGHHQVRHPCDLLEDLYLVQRILPRGGVEHEHHAVRRGRIELLHHAHDLVELSHQIGLVLQAPSRVDDERPALLGARSLERLI